MIDPRIPDEAVEAAARAICRCRGIDPEEALPEEIREGSGPWPYWSVFVGDARAALAAAINAWPDAGMRTIMDANGSYPTVFLPLPGPEEKP